MQRYFNTVANQNGKALAGASIIVKNFSDLTTATVYSTNSAAVANVKTNPLTSGSDGSFWFYAADGHYNLVVIPSGGSTSTVYDQLLEDTDNGVPVASTATVALTASTATWAIGGGTSSYAGTSGASAVAAVASTATTALAASTATAAITASTATSVKGTITNDNAAAGFVGEYITQSPAGFAIGNGTAANMSTATILSGDYEAWGQAYFTPGASSGVTMLSVGINTTSAALAGEGTYERHLSASFTPGSSIMSLQAPLQRITVSSAAGTATVFLVVVSSFSTSSMSCGGVLNLRRRR